MQNKVQAAIFTDGFYGIIFPGGFFRADTGAARQRKVIVCRPAQEPLSFPGQSE